MSYIKASHPVAFELLVNLGRRAHKSRVRYSQYSNSPHAVDAVRQRLEGEKLEAWNTFQAAKAIAYEAAATVP